MNFVVLYKYIGFYWNFYLRVFSYNVKNVSFFSAFVSVRGTARYCKMNFVVLYKYVGFYWSFYLRVFSYNVSFFFLSGISLMQTM